ncbi:MAG: extracellular solute-binding protein [Treponema sp.]|jgi:raffinose/stachyose/melibiose transport system substrate-binding protein|nr:extracellular solute-binding protein [Treponema sp.]
MKITEKTIVLGLSALLVFAAAGCKKEGQSAVSGPEVRVLNYLDLTIANSAQEITDVWDKFSQNHPDIGVVREDLFNEPFHNKIEAYAAAGQLPDVVYAWPSGRSTTLHTQHLLKDLGPLIQKDGLGSVMLPGALDPNAQGAGYIGILPRAITSSHAFYVNNEVLRDAGLQPARTYAELKAQVPVLRAKGYQTVLMANQDTWVMQSCLFSLIAGRFGGEGWEKKILSGEAKFTDPDFVKALEFVRTLYDDGVLSRDSLTTDYGSVVGQFATNRGAYLVDGDWRIAAFITDKSTGEGLIDPERQRDFAITVFPDIEDAKLNKSTSGILGTGWGISAAVPAGSEQEAAAWELVKWLSGKEIQTWLLETGGITTPTRTDIDVTGLTLEPLQVAGGNLASQYDTTTAVIDGVFDAEIHVPINDGLQAIGMGAATPQQIAAAAQQAFESWKAKQ